MDRKAGRRREPASAGFYRVVLAVGLLLGLAANLPGHLSVDSVIALQEARADTRVTWAPAAFSWAIGLFDDLVAGTGLYVTACATLLFASLMALPGLRRRSSWVAVAVAAAAVATPQILIYQGIVWRDVLFANLAVAGFVCLAYAARDWSARKNLLAVLAALALLALAAAVRQNGMVLLLAAAAALGWTARGGGLRGALAWGAGFLLAGVVLALAVDRVAQPPNTTPGLREDASLRILQHYDVVGAVAQDPTIRLDEIGRVRPAAQALIESEAGRIYSSSRVDTLDQEPGFRIALWRTPDAVMAAQWRAILLEHPLDYLRHRLAAFRWVVLTPELQKCLPVHVGVGGPEATLAELQIVEGLDPADRALHRYAQGFYGTPIFSHLAFAVAAIVLIGLLLLRRDPVDWMVVGLLAGSLAFVASFLPISVACDYRYLYLLDLTVIAAVLYVALDPPGLARRR